MKILRMNLLLTIASAIIFSGVALAQQPVVNTNINVEITGSEAFDATTWDGSANAGTDANGDNNVVRLQDTVTYRVELSVNDAAVDHLTATVVLDPPESSTKKIQAWIRIPNGCETDPNIVTPVSSISTDKRTLFCNTGPAIEGTTKIIFPTARAIGVSSDGTEIALNDDRIGASVTAQADGATGISELANDGPTETIVTANFSVDTIKELKNTATDELGNFTYVPFRAPGPGGEDGMVMEYVIRLAYQNGSMLADSDEVTYEVDYDLFDFFTDDHTLNNNNSNLLGNGPLSTGALLYTWGPDGADGACSLDGDHGPNATVACAQNDIVGDWVGSTGLGADGENDPNINIDLDNIDVRDPDNDANLLKLAINIWVPRADIDSHPLGAHFLLNHIGSYDTISGEVSGFNPVSTEDASGNNLLNFNTGLEPLENNNFDFAVPFANPGSHFYAKSFHSANAAKLNNTKSVAQGQQVPFFLEMNNARLIDGDRHQICDKIDTSQYIFNGLDNNVYAGSVLSRLSLGRHGLATTLYYRNPDTSARVYTDATSITKYLYTDHPNGSGSIADLQTTRCDDDTNNDGKFVVDGVNQVTLLNDAPNDWVTDPEDLTGGTASVTRLRKDFTIDLASRTALNPDDPLLVTASRYFSIFNVIVRNDATGYGPNRYLPNYISHRDNIGTSDGSFNSWVDDTSPTDPNESSFGLATRNADRNMLVDSGHSIEKYTSPQGIKVIRGGEIVQFVLEPKVFLGALDSIADDTVIIEDSIPSGLEYLLGSEEFSSDGGVTWQNLSEFNDPVSGNSVTVTSPINTNIRNLDWTFGSIESGDQLPLIRYLVQADSGLVSGQFTNTAEIRSDLADDQSALYTLQIFPEFGFDVLKEVDQVVYSTNAPFSYDLTYKNLGGEDYGEAVFIDILPFNTDGANASGGLASNRDPSTIHTNYYEVTELTQSSAGEIFYATDVDPSTLNSDPCHEDNLTVGYMPVAGDLCYSMYVNNNNQFAGGASAGTGVANWQQCTSLTVPVTCGTLAPEDITALRFVAPSVSSEGGQTVSVELTPVGNLGGVPDLNANGDVTAASTGDIFTNTFSGRIGEISLLVISNDVSVTMVSGSIGDFVFFDVDGDGVQDIDELPLEGVTLSLEDDMGNPIYRDPVTGAIVPSTFPDAEPYVVMTDVDGNYIFDNLPAGNYNVVVDESTLPPGMTQSVDPDGTMDSMSSHSLMLETDEFGNTTGVENNVDQDFGYTRPLPSLGDTVFYDADQDGVQDIAEQGVAGVTVNLYDDVGSLVGTTVTDGNGNYLFEDLLPGDYTVEFIPPAGYEFSPQNAGQDGFDSDADPVSGTTAPIAIGFEDDMTVDAGIYLPSSDPSTPIEPGSIGDTVWLDADGDGVQDSNESGVPGVVVELFDDSGNLIATTTTDANGNYLFEGLPAGDYQITFTPPTGFDFTAPNSSADDTLDSDANPLTGETGNISLGAGEDITDIDAGLTTPGGGADLASLGDTVWYDADGDGVQDVDEVGVPGVLVTLYDAAGNTIATTTTDANGNYLFPNLMPGDYSVGFNPPSGYSFTTQNSGGDDTVDSDVDLASWQTDPVTINAGDDYRDLDAGLILPPGVEPASLGDTVWFDENSDGVQSSSEAGLEGVTVNLYDAAGNLLATTVTDADGNYLFENLAPGDYVVGFVSPEGMTLTSQDSGSDEALDSDADESNGYTDTIALASGEDNRDVDAGFIETDSDGDGIVDNEEGTGDDDGDGIPNNLDEDSDNDGIPDAVERGDGDTPIDTDADGIPDYLDLDSDNDGILDSVEGDGDTDGDGIPNNLDIDSDGDGITDNYEAFPTSGYVEPSGVDSNGNGVDDAYDTTVPPVIDTDGDGLPDYLDTDSDNDGVSDFIEATDVDGDGVSDIELTGQDSDGDGLDDAVDNIDNNAPGASPFLNPAGSNIALPTSEGSSEHNFRLPPTRAPGSEQCGNLFGDQVAIDGAGLALSRLLDDALLRNRRLTKRGQCDGISKAQFRKRRNVSRNHYNTIWEETWRIPSIDFRSCADAYTNCEERSTTMHKDVVRMYSNKLYRKMKKTLRMCKDKIPRRYLRNSSELRGTLNEHLNTLPDAVLTCK